MIFDKSVLRYDSDTDDWRYQRSMIDARAKFATAVISKHINISEQRSIVLIEGLNNAKLFLKSFAKYST